MRIRLPLGRSLFFLCAFLFALVALMPLRLGLDWLGLEERGFAAREARGSIWFGGLSEAQLGSVALGDLAARLQGLPLILGRARVEVQRVDERDALSGGLTVSGHAFGIDDVTGDVNVGAAFAPLPVARLDVGDLSARFNESLCASAEGRVRATLAGDVAGLSLPGGFSGNARCDDGALLLPMVSQTGMEALNLRLHGDGRYRVELAVRPTDDAMRDRLVRAGFALAGGSYVLRVSGEL